MSEFLQPALPGFPLRIIVSAVWEDPSRSCTIRATVDYPTDELSSSMIGSDTSGRMTWDELGSAMATALLGTMDSAHSALGLDGR